VLKVSFPDVIFLEGSSTRNVLLSDDKVAEVARKVLKRLVLKSKMKAFVYKAMQRLIPVVLSTMALSL
jgi:hypothetical protein